MAEAPAQEDPKTEEPTKEEPKTEASIEVAAKDSKAEAAAAEEAKPTKPEPEEKTVVVAEEEGIDTVEAIEEAVVPAASEPVAAAEAEAPATEPKEELIWGVLLVGDDEHTDTVLLKFLHAWEFKVKEAMAMLKVVVLWCKRFGIDVLLGADLGLSEMENKVFYCGADREGHPVCYNVYDEFQDKELYEKAFSDEEKRERFLKWRTQLLEHGIHEQLEFAPSGIYSIVQVTNLKNSPPMLGKHRAITRLALTLLQDNYPEFIAKKGKTGSHFESKKIPAPLTNKANWEKINPFALDFTEAVIIGKGQLLWTVLQPCCIAKCVGGWKSLCHHNDPMKGFFSGSKFKEMIGSRIFVDKSENAISEASNPANKSYVRLYQVSGHAQFLGSHSVSLNSDNLQLLRQRYYYATWKANGT